MTAAKWPGHPTPAPLLAILGTWGLIPVTTCLGWLDLVVLAHGSPPARGTLCGSLPLPLSWNPVGAGQEAPSSPLRLPGTKLRRKRTLPCYRLAGPCITSIRGHLLSRRCRHLPETLGIRLSKGPLLKSPAPQSYPPAHGPSQSCLPKQRLPMQPQLLPDKQARLPPPPPPHFHAATTTISAEKNQMK